MDDLVGRAFNAAKGAVDAARGRIEEIDSRAQAELDKVLHIDGPEQYATGADDPFARASAKIAAAQLKATAQKEAQAASDGATAPLPTNPIDTAYKILGLPVGADYSVVSAAVEQLRTRCSPSRFPEGSDEQAEAKTILLRVEEANTVLQESLDPHTSRFGKLEL